MKVRAEAASEPQGSHNSDNLDPVAETSLMPY